MSGLGVIAVFSVQALVYSAAQARPPASEPVATRPALDGDRLREWLEPIRRTRRLPALAAAVVQGDRITAAAVGVRRAGTRTRVTLDDQFHIGSCTKSMTATLCARLVEQGRLRWDLTIGEAFADVANIDADLRTATLEQLLCHRTGLAEDRAPDLVVFPQLRLLGGPIAEQRTKMAALVLPRKPAARPGARFAYSNMGYALAGAMAERATQRTYEVLMRELVFEPLGMTTAGFGPPGTHGRIDQPLGHSRVLGISTAHGPEPLSDNPMCIASAGTVHCSIGDLARYARMHLRGARGEAGESSLLRAETMARLQSDPFAQEYGFGWVIAKRPWAGGEILAHDGSNGLWYAVIVVAPQRNAAFVVATNLGNAAAAEGCHDAIKAMREQVLGD